MRFKRVRKDKLLFIFIACFTVFCFACNNFTLAKSEGEVETFFVQKDYDISQRTSINARLVKISQKAYFYVESEWYLNISDEQRAIVNANLNQLTQAFDKEIYPKLTALWGAEWSPGIDNDPKITILFEQMAQDVVGYFTDANEYMRQQSPNSNEREMIYLSTNALQSKLLKSYVAHEFTHLITFNQKDRQKGVSEDVWLNEMRAEYSPYYLGYDPEGVNIAQRINDFAQSPSDSLTNWESKRTDYGVVVMFGYYLVQQYGVDILVSSLHSNKTGIVSLQEAIAQKGETKDLLQIFNDWAVAVFLNDCSLGEKWCYKNPLLANVHLPANIIVLPSRGRTNLALSYSLSEWSSNWYKFIGSEGDLKITFTFDPKGVFALKYVLCEAKGCKVSDFFIDDSKKPELLIPNFSGRYLSLSLIPSVKARDGTTNKPSLFVFSVNVQTSNEPSRLTQEEALMNELLMQIEQLKAQIAQTQAQILAMRKNIISCASFEKNLFLGLRDKEVSCLQEFLKSQGSDIYPQGIVSGYFGALTKAAVMRFQAKYGILATGYVGPLTRAKINQMLAQ